LLRPGESDMADRPLMKRRSAATMDEQPPREMPQWGDDCAVAAKREAAEAKRLEARRRFLLGSGAALSALVTTSPGRVGAVAYSECTGGRCAVAEEQQSPRPHMANTQPSQPVTGHVRYRARIPAVGIVDVRFPAVLAASPSAADATVYQPHGRQLTPKLP
jgi:hypothetical protein